MLSFINRASARRISTSALSLPMLMIGDSIANGTASTYASDYISELSIYGINGTIYDAAQGGLNLADFYDAGARGAYYTARITNDNAANLANINSALIGIGTNDGGSHGSKSAWKSNLQDLVNELKNDPDLSALTHIYIRPIGHYTTHYNYELSWQDMREAQIEVVQENEGVYLLPSYVDLELADNVHPTNASYQIMIEREAQHIAYILGQYDTPVRDTILKIDNLDFYTHAHYGKTIVSGNDFSSIGALNGNPMDILNDNWVYDDTAFDGFGGMIPTSVSAGLHCGDIMTMANGFMFGFTVDVQANGDLVLLGSTSYGPYGSAAFFVEDGDFKAFRFDSSPNLPTLVSNVIGQRLSIIVDCQGQTEMNIYINNDTPITHDPWSNFIGWTNLFLNGGRGFGSTDNIFGCVWGKSGAHDNVNDPSITEIMNAMKRDYNIV
jgi:lysophospholipase L1-like esterase